MDHACLLSPDVDFDQLPRPDRPARLGFLASGSGSNFGVIAASIQRGEIAAEITSVIYNNPEAKVKARAQQWDIPTHLFNHREFGSREALDGAIVAQFQKEQVDWVIMAGWMRIVTPVLLQAYDNHVINIHPSLLPSFRGIRAVEQALEAKVKITGCTVHLASVEVDSGPILMQAAVPILPTDTPETLHARIQVQEHWIFPRAIAMAIGGMGKTR